MTKSTCRVLRQLSRGNLYRRLPVLDDAFNYLLHNFLASVLGLLVASGTQQSNTKNLYTLDIATLLRVGER